MTAAVIYPPIIVLGTGRSGTTTVANALRSGLGLYMGLNLNLRGEDVQWVGLNDALLHERIEPRDWLAGVRQLAAIREMRGTPWGFKDPAFAQFAELSGEIFAHPPIFVRCNRDPRAAAASWARCSGNDVHKGRRIVRLRTRALDRLPRDRTVVLQLETDIMGVSPDVLAKRLRRAIRNKGVEL